MLRDELASNSRLRYEKRPSGGNNRNVQHLRSSKRLKSHVRLNLKQRLYRTDLKTRQLCGQLRSQLTVCGERSSQPCQFQTECSLYLSISTRSGRRNRFAKPPSGKRQNCIARALICKKTVSLFFLSFEYYQEKAQKWAARLREAQTSRRTDYCMLEGRLGQQSTEALRQRFAGRG